MFSAKNPILTEEHVGQFIADEHIIPYFKTQAMNFLKDGDCAGQIEYAMTSIRDTYYGIAYAYLSAIDIIRIARGESLALKVKE